MITANVDKEKEENMIYNEGDVIELEDLENAPDDLAVERRNGEWVVVAAPKTEAQKVAEEIAGETGFPVEDLELVVQMIWERYPRPVNKRYADRDGDIWTSESNGMYRLTHKDGRRTNHLLSLEGVREDYGPLVDISD